MGRSVFDYTRSNQVNVVPKFSEIQNQHLRSLKWFFTKKNNEENTDK